MKKEKDGETDFIQLCECVCVCHFYTVFESLPVFFAAAAVSLYIRPRNQAELYKGQVIRHYVVRVL